MKLIGAIIVVLSLVGGYVAFTQYQATDEGSIAGPVINADEPVVTIRYTNGGYQPPMVTIKAGQKVRWLNDADDETWPASAVHPTHGIYPEKTAGDCLGSAFDACRGLKKGEQWDFVFTQKGTWRFHDHLHPSKTGSVIVE